MILTYFNINAPLIVYLDSLCLCRDSLVSWIWVTFPRSKTCIQSFFWIKALAQKLRNWRSAWTYQHGMNDRPGPPLSHISLSLTLSRSDIHLRKYYIIFFILESLESIIKKINQLPSIYGSHFPYTVESKYFWSSIWFL